jgi:hypothetical protein
VFFASLMFECKEHKVIISEALGLPIQRLLNDLNTFAQKLKCKK